MFWTKNTKNMYTPAFPKFYYIKMGFKGVCNARTYFPCTLRLMSVKRNNASNVLNLTLIVNGCILILMYISLLLIVCQMILF